MDQKVHRSKTVDIVITKLVRAVVDNTIPGHSLEQDSERFQHAKEAITPMIEILLHNMICDTGDSPAEAARKVLAAT